MTDDADRIRELLFRHFDEEDGRRRRAARFLHDEVAQTLAVLKMELAASPGGAALAPLIDETVRRTRELSRETWPAALDDLGLAPAAAGLLRRCDPRGEIQFACDPPAPDLPPALRRAAYRILELALARFSGGGGRIELRAGTAGIALEVEFSGAAASSGWGDSPEMAEIGLRVGRLRGRVVDAGQDGHPLRLRIIFPPCEDATP